MAIVRALVLQPELLIADKPTSALDVSAQSEILSLLKRLDLHLSILFTSHDLAVVRNPCSHVVMIHHNVIVENDTTAAISDRLMDFYTKNLLAAIPHMESSWPDGTSDPMLVSW